MPGEAVPGEAGPVEAEPDNEGPDEADSVEADAGDVIDEEDVDSGDESVKIYPYKMRRNEREFLKDEVELSDIKFLSVLVYFTVLKIIRFVLSIFSFRYCIYFKVF